MGTYFDPENQSFLSAVRSKVYVDKTGLLNLLNDLVGTEQKCIAISHARRFGKSQAAGMIKAYYSMGCDSKELFSRFEIAQSPDFEKYLNKYHVIHLDISSVADSHKDDLIDAIMDRLVSEIRQDYADCCESNDIERILAAIYKKSGIPFVIIIDEWDCVIRNLSDRPDIVHAYMQFLHSIFKSEESKSFLALGYITGILPIKKIKDESALNNFCEYTMLSSGAFTRYYGFTEDEVKGLCLQYGMDFDSVKAWYNGYLISGRHMYNPNSVVRAMTENRIASYWKDTSAFSSINSLISLNFGGLKEDILSIASGTHVAVKTGNFGNDLSEIHSKDDALTALIHLGYLAFDEEESEAFMPNYEVASAFASALETGDWSEVAEAMSRSDDLLRSTVRMQADKVAAILDLAHEGYSSVLTYNDENSLACAVRMAYFTAPAYYSIFRELPAGKGFADLAFIPRREAGKRPAMIVELKWDQSADTAIRQIKEKRYTGALAAYEDILLVGISYDRQTKKHSCVIEWGKSSGV